MIGFLILLLVSQPAHAVRPSIADLQAQIAALQAYTDPLQTYLSVDESVPAKPVLRVTAANLQVVNGTGLTLNSQNGVGNLIVGYDDPRTSGDSVCSLGAFTDQAACENASEIWAISHKSGSHNLVVGWRHNYSQTSGLVAGNRNTVNGASASISGRNNVASGGSSSVSGGQGNEASSSTSSVSGGQSNMASGTGSSVSGGNTRTAAGINDWVAGGLFQDQ